MTSDHAPRSLGSARTIRSSHVAPISFAMACAMTSVSLEVAKRTPSRARSSRSSRALMQLPLCPIASSPRPLAVTTIGCAFWMREPPVVE